MGGPSHDDELAEDLTRTGPCCNWAGSYLLPDCVIQGPVEAACEIPYTVVNDVELIHSRSANHYQMEWFITNALIFSIFLQIRYFSC